MDITKVHILIEQGLQQVGVFAYSDFTHEEVDLQINKDIYNYIERMFNSKVYNPSRAPQNYFEVSQENLDRIQNLVETTIVTPVSTLEDRADFKLPEDYLHYINSRTNVAPTNYNCSTIGCKCLEEGKLYKVLEGDIVYNGVNYSEGSTFTGTTTKDYSIIPNGKVIKISEISTKTFRNRILGSADIYKCLENSLYTTRINSPLGTISKDKINIFKKDFLINSIELIYCRRPDEVSFEDAQDLNFPDDVCYEIINLVISNLSITSEQSQQKIVNNIDTGNVQR